MKLKTEAESAEVNLIFSESKPNKKSLFDSFPDYN